MGNSKIYESMGTVIYLLCKCWSHSTFCLLLIRLYPHTPPILGIPDERGRRALCWKLLLNYLPLTRTSWSETLSRKRELYRQFIGKSTGLFPSYVVC